MALHNIIAFSPQLNSEVGQRPDEISYNLLQHSGIVNGIGWCWEKLEEINEYICSNTFNSLNFN